jgi:hypothetical protein
MRECQLTESIVIAEWWKNRGGESIRVRLVPYAGRVLVDVRTYRSIEAKLLPSHQGFSADVRHLPRLAKIIAKAFSRAIGLDLIDGVRADPDLFDEPAPTVATPFLVRLERSIDHSNPCCGNLAFVYAGRGPHAAELKCAACGNHRGWLPKNALSFLLETARLFGATDEPVTIREHHAS